MWECFDLAGYNMTYDRIYLRVQAYETIFGSDHAYRIILAEIH
jgi:hypothetical protein